MWEISADRDTLKAELLQHIAALEKQHALLPSENPAIDVLIQRLESLNPIGCPLLPEYLPNLEGHWQLIYASRGTVVTRGLGPMPSLGQAIAIRQIWQQLTVTGQTRIAAINGAELDLPWFGSWRLCAEGDWTWDTPEQTAIVRFRAFSIQAINLLGQTQWQLPPLTIPAIKAWQNEALWLTSYLDTDVRIGRGATGNLFVFRRWHFLTEH